MVRRRSPEMYERLISKIPPLPEYLFWCTKASQVCIEGSLTDVLAYGDLLSVSTNQKNFLIDCWLVAQNELRSYRDEKQKQQMKGGNNGRSK